MKGTAYAAVQNNTADASEIQDSPVEVGSLWISEPSTVLTLLAEDLNLFFQ